MERNSAINRAKNTVLLKGSSEKNRVKSSNIKPLPLAIFDTMINIKKLKLPNSIKIDFTINDFEAAKYLKLTPLAQGRYRHQAH